MTVDYQTRFADGASLLLQLGWEQDGEGPLGETWVKGSRQTQLAYRTQGAEWTRFLAGLALAEGTTPSHLESQLVRPKLPRKPSGSERAEFDVHLTGPTIRGHEGIAKSLGQFVASFAESVKEIIKSDLGLGQLQDRLVVQGLRPGSLRVRFLEPEPESNGETLVDAPPGSPEGSALWRLGQIFNVANRVAATPEAEEDLSSMVAMTVSARRAIHKLSSIIEGSHWTTQGYLRGPQSSDPEPVSLSLSGAHRLRTVTQESTLRMSERRVTGHVDGWQWSDGMMRFVTSGDEAIRAAVPIGLHGTVAELIRDPHQEVDAAFNVTRRETPHGQVSQVSHVLRWIEAFPALMDL